MGLFLLMLILGHGIFSVRREGIWGVGGSGRVEEEFVIGSLVGLVGWEFIFTTSLYAGRFIGDRGVGSSICLFFLRCIIASVMTSV